MNAFAECSLLAARSLRDLHPFLLETQGHYVLTDKGRHSKLFQETFGDLIFNDKSGRMHTVELKAERRWTGNLFLEIWSNFNVGNGRNTAIGPNPGWLMKLSSDLLFYHFPNEDRLVLMSLPALQEWAFLHPSRNMSEPDGRGERRRLVGRAFDFRQAEQTAVEQLNKTVGALVPVSVLTREMKPPPRIRSVKQLKLDLFDEAA